MPKARVKVAKQAPNRRLPKNKIARAVIALLVCSLSVFCDGCAPLSALQTGSGVGTTDSADSTSFDQGSKTFPVKADLSRTIQVDFIHGDSARNTTKTYVLIQSEVPISDGKIGEGEADCEDNHLKPYDGTCPGEEFSAVVSEAQYTAPVRILRINFRSIRVIISPKSEPAEVLFLQKANPSMPSKGMGFFDVYLREDSLYLVDEPVDRSMSRYEEKKLLSLSDVLGDCGELIPEDDPAVIAEVIQLGGSEEEIKKINEERRKKLPPDSLDPITKDKVKKIISLNPSKKDLVEKTFDFNAENNPFIQSFRKIGSNLEMNHISYNEQLDLSPDIFNIAPPDYFSFVSAMTLTIMKKETDEVGSPTLMIEKEGKKYYYAPDITSKISKTLPLSDSNSQNLGISAVEFSSSPIVSDPWCGFTPESKPAIYLYPKRPTIVKIKLHPPVGWITTSRPQYQKNGWRVLAMPSGNLYQGFKSYSHLFYEAMLPTPKMPDKYVVLDGNDLLNELEDLGQKLSLNEKESKEMAQYWAEKLPKAAYYQVGLMSKVQIDQIEPLDVSPSPDIIYRIRLVFRELEQKIDSSYEPRINFDRKGFSLVEWGGFEIK